MGYDFEFLCVDWPSTPLSKSLDDIEEVMFLGY